MSASPLQPQLPELTIDRPVLIPPSQTGKAIPADATPPTLSELRFLAAMEAFRSFGDKLISNLSLRLESFRLTLQELSAENLQKLKESAEHAKSSNVWSMLQKIATSLLSALSIVIGISLVATGAGALVGGAMIGSGIVSLANLLLTETGIWDWIAKKLAHEDEEKRQLLAMILPASVGLLAATIGIFGSAGAFAWSGINFLDKAILIAQTSLALFDGATTIGKGYADAKTLWLEADQINTKSKITVEQEMIDNTTRSIENILDGLSATHAKSTQFVNMAMRSNQTVSEAFI